jgi:flagellar hook-associated protein 1 FlgK
MAGLFDGLEMGKRALATQQLWLNTIGHNISNVNTPGYSRQRVLTSTTIPQELPVGMVGTGVTATAIHNVRDLFLNQQYRQENKALGNWTALEKTITQIESLFVEPNDESLGDQLNNFWTSWSELANNPESISARTALKEQTNLLTNTFHRIYNQMLDLRKSVDTDIQLTLENVNTLSGEIASLNQQISKSELGGQQANDLRDRRDYLIDQLSQYVDINATEQKNNTTTVYIGALAIVDGNQSFRLGTKKVSSGEMATSAIVWEGSNQKIKNLSGELKGLVETRDEILPRYMEALDDIASTLVSNVNALHRVGYGLDGSSGYNYFNAMYTGAANITIDSIVGNDVNKIAASTGGEVGDNTNALAIADLRNSYTMARGTATINEYYNSLVGQVGVESSKATDLKESYEILVEQINNSRESVQGVSLDEEMANMIKYQNAFDAAARVITTMDQALDTVINGMGIVGR